MVHFVVTNIIVRGVCSALYSEPKVPPGCHAPYNSTYSEPRLHEISTVVTPSPKPLLIEWLHYQVSQYRICVDKAIGHSFIA